MSSDTWSDIQAYKNKRMSMREKLARRRKERQVQIETLTGKNLSPSAASSCQTTGGSSSSGGIVTSTSSQAIASSTLSLNADISSVPTNLAATKSGTGSDELLTQPPVHLPAELLNQVECHLLKMLSDITLMLPMEVASFTSSVRKQFGQNIPDSAVEDLMLDTQKDKGEKTLIVDVVDHVKLSAVTAELDETTTNNTSKKRKLESDDADLDKSSKQNKKLDNKDEDVIESLLSMESAKQRESKKLTDEILQLLSKPTAKEQSLIEKFKSVGGAQVKEFCPNGTKEECIKVSLNNSPCDKLHFRKIIHKHTDESLGDCSFLNTCFHMDTCKYVHYEIDYPEKKILPKNEVALSLKQIKEGATILFPPQWIQCDVRKFDMTVLGKFSVIMADPPWDIHMELPYGTMSDDEMRKLPVPAMQDDGYIFLWVTGRFFLYSFLFQSYERVDELIWVKTNQLQRIIRTGRTGHWLNHGKEHCLVGVKGNPKNVNRGLDCDVIVAEVRATSHKPDEIYGIIERLSPGTRKLELFGRPHNVQPNWVTLGNQLDGIKLTEPEVVKAYKERYPEGYSL
ncbi:hypothetical protein LSH36_532g03047 [Paralvinella palmiformis]|uniref:mRNA m(6)A methyltransferase n=1 Tax=Paralvinella palmiformis TaxID=53620 RepID=A0AAD9J7E7_9ANNE|nr:hypothetical protein LSH36_532g03047 [Paralvinella palmiformis]